MTTQDFKKYGTMAVHVTAGLAGAAVAVGGAIDAFKKFKAKNYKAGFMATAVTIVGLAAVTYATDALNIGNPVKLPS